MSGITSHIGLLMVDLHIPGAHSLKDKRMVIKSAKQRIRNEFNVSVAELGEQDKWQRALLGIVMLSGDKRFVEAALSKIKDRLNTLERARLIDSNIQWL
ncbi:MAG: DUF503 domain-containing protein [Bdellovibrionota bacterium]